MAGIPPKWKESGWNFWAGSWTIVCDSRRGLSSGLSRESTVGVGRETCLVFLFPPNKQKANFTRHIFNVFDFYQLHILWTSEVRLSTGTSRLGLNPCAAIFKLPVVNQGLSALILPSPFWTILLWICPFKNVQSNNYSNFKPLLV